MLLAMWATGAVAAEAQHANRRQLVGRGHCLEADVYGPQMTVWDQVQYFTNPDFATALVNTVYCARADALAGLDSVLNSASQNYTIFCPLDAAFLDLEQTDKAQFDALLSDPAEALRIMSFHVIDHLVLSSSFRHGDDDYMFTDNVITTHLGPDVTVRGSSYTSPVCTAQNKQGVPHIFSSSNANNECKPCYSHCLVNGDGTSAVHRTGTAHEACNGELMFVDHVLIPPATSATSGDIGGSQQDPHLHFPHGGSADLRGRNGALCTSHPRRGERCQARSASP